MWRPTSESEPEEPDEVPANPAPTGPVSHVEPRGRDLTARASQRAADRAALERLKAEIDKSLLEYAKYLKYEQERSR